MQRSLKEFKIELGPNMLQLGLQKQEFERLNKSTPAHRNNITEKKKILGTCIILSKGIDYIRVKIYVSR